MERESKIVHLQEEEGVTSDLRKKGKCVSGSLVSKTTLVMGFPGGVLVSLPSSINVDKQQKTCGKVQVEARDTCNLSYLWCFYLIHV